MVRLTSAAIGSILRDFGPEFSHWVRPPKCDAVQQGPNSEPTCGNRARVMRYSIRRNGLRAEICRRRLGNTWRQVGRFRLGPVRARRANRSPVDEQPLMFCVVRRSLGGVMDGYRTVVVGTDGSVSSLRAVERAGEVAAQADAKLIVASAHMPSVEKGGWSRAPSHDHVSDPRAADSLGGEGYKLHGSAPVYAILREARDRGQGRRRAKDRGAGDRRRAGPRTGEAGRGRQSRPARRRRRRVWTRSPDGCWARCPPKSPARPGSTSLSSTRPTRAGRLTEPSPIADGILKQPRQQRFIALNRRVLQEALLRPRAVGQLGAVRFGVAHRRQPIGHAHCAHDSNEVLGEDRARVVRGDVADVGAEVARQLRYGVAGWWTR